MKFKWLVMFLCLCGCSTPTAFRGKDTVVEAPAIIDWNYVTFPMGGSAKWWYQEAKKRFVRPVVFVCHGGYINNVWYAFPAPPRQAVPVEDVAWMLASLYPDQDIVMVVCNEEGEPNEGLHQLHVKRVWYSPHGVVWMSPKGHCWLFDRFKVMPGVDSIWDFVSYDGCDAPNPRPFLGQPTTQASNR
jgi:hypothetical protein